MYFSTHKIERVLNKRKAETERNGAKISIQWWEDRVKNKNVNTETSWGEYMKRSEEMDTDL